jgi:hypothetical protein
VPERDVRSQGVDVAGDRRSGGGRVVAVRVEQVGRVVDDLEGGGADLVEYGDRLVGRGDDVAVLGLDGECETVVLGEPLRAWRAVRESAHACGLALSGCQRHMSSGSRDPLLSVMMPICKSRATVHRCGNRAR